MKDARARRVALGARGVRPATTLRQVATRTFLPGTGGSNSLKQLMSRTAHFMRSKGGVTGVRVVFAGFYLSSGAETAAGATASITASVEYPAGIFTQVKFSGSATGTIPNGGYLVSDMASVSIPEEAMFWVRSFHTNTTGVLYLNSSTGMASAALGDFTDYAASGLADQTMSGTLTFVSANANNAYFPAAILGNSYTPSPVLLGDSRVLGVGDTFDLSGNLGALARTIGAGLPYLNLSGGGAQSAGLISNGTNRFSLAGYGTSAVIQYGINEVNGAVAAATIQTNRNTARGLLPAGMTAWQTTLEPNTTSTDAFATTANQTVTANEAIRTTFNTAVRAQVSGWAGHMDLAGAIETSGKWRVLGGTINALTADGLHCNQTGYIEQARYGAVNSGVFS